MRAAVVAGPSFMPEKNCMRWETRGSTPGILESASWTKEVMANVGYCAGLGGTGVFEGANHLATVYKPEPRLELDESTYR
jgi:hypothetical protein